MAGRGASSSSIVPTCCVRVPSSRSTIDAGTRPTSTPMSRVQIEANIPVRRNGPCHQPSQESARTA
ncbi:hypothetical protein BE17_16280 [Sorangium cellulosum]|uniref:Uncharacterized protein n=1 Tax=Sorangium cellulosum TaxID=56 RepID=A0A150SPR2_SORCE|nr:hypothetical protein BE17_16280 [Sorangium cellulosum]